MSKIMEDFNTKRYVMNNEETAFSIKTIRGSFVFINEKNKSKEIQGKNVLSFTKFVMGGLAWGFLSGVYARGVVLIPVASHQTELHTNVLHFIL